MDSAKELIEEIRGGLLAWYDFEDAEHVLYIGGADDALPKMLESRSFQLTCLEVGCLEDACWQRDIGKFDYIISIADLEQTKDPVQLLATLKLFLCPNGRLLLGMNNRLGIRYFCGDRDPYTGRNFDSIEDYQRVYSRVEDDFFGRMYSEAEIREMLEKCGLQHCKFFSVLPDLNHAALIYAEDYLPNEALANRVFPKYNCPDTVFLDEKNLYETLEHNGLFHKMANAYLVECSLLGDSSDIEHVTASMERGKNQALLTVVRKGGIVEKRAVWPEGNQQLENLQGNMQDLAKHGIRTVPAEFHDGIYVMPYMKAETGQVYLQRLLQQDQKKFVQEMDRFRSLILQSSEKIDRQDGQGFILEHGYIDLVPLNSFYLDGEFIFFDQEFCQMNCPANFILLRMLGSFYAYNPEAERLLPMRRLIERYGLVEQWDNLAAMDQSFIARLRNIDGLRVYMSHCQADPEQINENRQRINYAEERYQRIFADVFVDVADRQLVLFGSGRYAQRLLEMYGKDYPVVAILDNNKKRWGTDVMGVPVLSSQELSRFNSQKYKIIVCIKNYLSVVRQLEHNEIRDYGIFDPNLSYLRREIGPLKSEGNKELSAKKYHVGYISGVFDLFHVGHLNMFKRAKELCDYLIVGVVSDEGVCKFKHVEPFIPFEERIEMVRSCRYVDKAEKIPLNFNGTRDAWRMYHFDVQFSGSDYINDTYWLAEREFLHKHGAELVFFPYTEQTSSTKIKALIDEKLV